VRKIHALRQRRAARFLHSKTVERKGSVTVGLCIHGDSPWRS